MDEKKTGRSLFLAVSQTLGGIGVSCVRANFSHEMIMNGIIKIII
jgi:hypothetical protein